MQQGAPTELSVAAFRVIPTDVPAIDEPGLPPLMRDLVLRPQGLVLITGPTGHGKSSAHCAAHTGSSQPVSGATGRIEKRGACGIIAATALPRRWSPGRRTA